MLYKYYSDKTIQNFVIHFATKSILNCPTKKNSLNFLKTKIIQFTLSHIKSFFIKEFYNIDDKTSSSDSYGKLVYRFS